ERQRTLAGRGAGLQSRDDGVKVDAAPSFPAPCFSALIGKQSPQIFPQTKRVYKHTQPAVPIKSLDVGGELSRQRPQVLDELRSGQLLDEIGVACQPLPREVEVTLDDRGKLWSQQPLHCLHLLRVQVLAKLIGKLGQRLFDPLPQSIDALRGSFDDVGRILRFSQGSDLAPDLASFCLNRLQVTTE